VELNLFEVFLYAIGLKFPNLKDNPSLVNRNFDVESYLNQSKEAREDNDPLVIFPEVIYNLI